MSTRAKATLAASVCFCAFTVWGVHYLQQSEREVRHAPRLLSHVPGRARRS